MNNVLIPLEYRENSADAVGPKHYARQTYLQKLRKYDLAPVFISSVMGESAVAQKFQQASGVLLMGGLDIHTKHYTEQSAHDENRFYRQSSRDKLELKLVRKAVGRNLPILGICRGCQLLAVASGGSLYQHLPEAVTDETHGESVDGEGYDHVLNVTHTVRIKEDTKLFDIIRQKEVTVNSGHHQAVRDPGDGMQISAVTEGGVVEAIENTKDNHFCIGLQSHPEAQDDGPLEKVFQSFRSAVAKK